MNDLLTLNAPEVFEGHDGHRHFAELFYGPGAGRAVIVFTAPADHQRNQDLTLGLLSALGTVLSVYPGLGPWSDLTVHTDADPGRTHGVGENRLHIDMVDRDLTPRIIALYCVRDDPQGGGASALADMWSAVDSLSDGDREALKQSVYRYWTDEGVHGVGRSLERFPIVPQELTGGFPVRFTSKMGPHLEKGELVDTNLVSADQAAGAFSRLAEAVYAVRTTHRLQPGQVLVWDQQRYAHGRMPLGEGQAELPEDRRRLLRQTYVAERTAL
ncbi:TauD/TfdA family dioxygenase [Streptomyces sp. GbtcB6]|uniref:TauD/TfdA family dioxygenase n=1 Tax=Streptomyces sp. GbtcB6 TaxID=2824751 RepID=UPI001C311677|nr:TauD/TfdA family dioxygenase [Streptomyces sp. GbtcB6]